MAKDAADLTEEEREELGFNDDECPMDDYMWDGMNEDAENQENGLCD